MEYQKQNRLFMHEISYRAVGYAIGAMAVEIAKLRKLDINDNDVIAKIIDEFESKGEKYVTSYVQNQREA